ncbi:MAG TPA: polysaccharide deacetylase family protein [Burkholderiaceae bacterium]|nr:polysaccharide deacetylase family protein [Burkholderiaceae bacterium]
MLQFGYRRDYPPTPATPPGPGEDEQRWIRYSALPERPALRWPGAAPVALWVCVNVLHYEYLPPADPWLECWTRMPAPDVMGFGRQEYGNRVGFHRIVQVMDRLGVRCTAIANPLALELYPDIAEAIAERGWEVAGHGQCNTRFTYGLSAGQERAYYQAMQDSVRRTTGQRMRGMGGPGPQSATENTPDILAELGYTYYTDFFCDEQPFDIDVRSGRLLSMPYSVELNDSPVLGSAFEADDFEEIVRRQFDRLHVEGLRSGRVMCVSVHPMLFGQPQRIGYLERALGHCLSRGGVWQATGSEIADHYLAVTPRPAGGGGGPGAASSG